MPSQTPASTAALLLVLAPLTLATAQTNNYLNVFETVDSIDAQYRNIFKITGIIQGEATPRTLSFSTNGSTDASLAELVRVCERYSLIAMGKPGLYYLETRGYTGNALQGCKLTRR